MKKKLSFTICLMMICLITRSQNTSTPQALPQISSKDTAKEKVYTIVEEMPVFPGGEDSLLHYLQKSIKYPSEARSKNITGMVYITFVINKEGKIKDSQVLRGIGGGCDEEALRVINNMPIWKPGMQNGKTVNVQYNIPIRFSL